MPPRLLSSFVELALQRQRLALVHLLEGAVLAHLLEVLEALDRRLDGLEVGQHAAEPAGVDVGHAGAARFLGDDLARLALGADEQDRALVRGQLADELHRLLVHLHRLLEVDDVDLVALAEDVLGHLRVPVAGLVAEVDSGFQHLTHRDGHAETPFRVEPRPAVCDAARSRGGGRRRTVPGTLRFRGSANCPVPAAGPSAVRRSARNCYPPAGRRFCPVIRSRAPDPS